MVKDEILMLGNLIERLEGAVASFQSSNDPEELYDLATEADSLYGSSVDGLCDAFEVLKDNSRLAFRQSKVIIQLLKREFARQECAFSAGIMPLTLDKLSVCPSAQEVYRSGVKKYSEGVYERNVLDDMRLALELLVKQLLGNQKSLENQMSELGQALSGHHNELRNLINKTLDYLCKYQNSYVKHNDAVDSTEVDFIIEHTSATINFLIAALSGRT